MRSFITLSILLFFCSVTVVAQSSTALKAATELPAPLPQTVPIPSDCDKAKDDKSLDNIVGCAQHIYDKVFAKEGVHAEIGTIVPGSGIGGGIGYTSPEKKFGADNRWRLQFNASAKITVRKFWEVDSDLRITKGHARGNIYGRYRDMRRLDFFGLGPESSLSGGAKYHEREGLIGADILKPVAKWLDLGSALENIWPRLVKITDPDVVSINQVYSDTSAPGLLAQPDFLHYVAFAQLHTAEEPENRKVNYRFYYHVYHDWQLGKYSFRRFEADLDHKFKLDEKNLLRLHGRLSFSNTDRGQQVPFYLQETLGGTNLLNADTLRGFRDYRFRDRNFILVQAEYVRQVYGPLKFIAFYDTGKVASGFKDFDVGRWRHTYGFGVLVLPRINEDVLFRFYVALGSGEGSHTFFGLGDGLANKGDRLVR